VLSGETYRNWSAVSKLPSNCRRTFAKIGDRYLYVMIIVCLLILSFHYRAMLRRPIEHGISQLSAGYCLLSLWLVVSSSSRKPARWKNQTSVIRRWFAIRVESVPSKKLGPARTRPRVPLQVVRPSIRQSVCDIEVLWNLWSYSISVVHKN